MRLPVDTGMERVSVRLVREGVRRWGQESPSILLPPSGCTRAGTSLKAASSPEV